MIQVTSISQYGFSMSTQTGIGRASPLSITLPSKSKHPNFVRFMKENLKNFTPSAKQQLAEGVQLGLVRVDEIDGVHVAPDQHLVPSPILQEDLAGMIDATVQFKNDFNAHVVNTAFHTVAGATLVTAATPTTWATIYVLIADEQAQHTAHLADAAAHPFVDISNGLTLGVPATPAQAVAAMFELRTRYKSHLQFGYDAATGQLTPQQIITY